MAFYLLFIILFASLIPLQERINRLREEEKLIEVEIFEATTPSDVWGTLLLGGFRGIAVNILWVRAMRLQWIEEDFLELVALYGIIQALQPRFALIWSFSSWNMAYNIAGQVDTEEEKWKWIQAGVSDLEKGIKRNPGNFRLLLELGWFYFDRMGGEAVRRPDAPFHRRQLQKKGRDHLYMALYWFERAAKVEKDTIIAGRAVAQVFERLATRAEKEGQLEKKVFYQKKTLERWRRNLEIDPDDAASQRHYQRWREKIYMER
ncbi:hypothetical protein B9J77_02175 [candidate division NPL-UPA2 bacterium Unc8]|uniref:Uncharacterized protein n=2 Tax=Bacteria TaxID=2 RepID=A0A9E2BG69_PSYF1|nr:hypothetical protein [Candidatus Psychracetigena formicireducens]MBT9144983.1 hypothetical protein [Candidatus Psychracetigena formicireducens]RII00556.1 MAG: hypothetical protein B9J77_02175 [candidate division NPL-UPA2 bacterium Unc8]